MPRPYDRLHATLNRVVDHHEIDALVVSDGGGLLIDANATCRNPEPLAALAALSVHPRRPFARERTDPSPTVTREVSMDGFDILVAAVGDPERCDAAIDAALPEVRALVA